jgi:hypothetical protein
MYIKKEYDFNDLKNNSWSGAIITIKRIEKENKEDALMELLEELFSDSIPDETQINDFLWFDNDYIYESLGISDNEDDEGI